MAKPKRYKRRIRKRRKPKKRRPRVWPLSTMWMKAGRLAQFRARHEPVDENHWVVDKGIQTWESPRYFKSRYDNIEWETDAWGTQSPPARIRQRLKIYSQLCLIVDKRMMSDNVVIVQVIYEEKIFWVLSRELCKPQRPI